MLAELFEFVTDREVIESLKNLGLKYEFLGGGKICFLDEELNDTGICVYFDEKGNVYRAEVETEYIESKEEFRNFLRTLKNKYDFLKKIKNLTVTARNYAWLEDVEEKLRGKPVIEHLGEICTFDEDLDAEVCFNFERKYGKDAVTWVKVKTKFLGGKEKFKKFLERLRAKYDLPRTIKVSVTTVPGKKFEEIREWYR